MPPKGGLRSDHQTAFWTYEGEALDTLLSGAKPRDNQPKPGREA